MKKKSSAPKNDRLNVMVLLDESPERSAKDIISSLKKLGFSLNEPALEAISVLTGSIPAAAEADILKVAGVAAVERVKDDYTVQ